MLDTLFHPNVPMTTLGRVVDGPDHGPSPPSFLKPEVVSGWNAKFGHAARTPHRDGRVATGEMTIPRIGGGEERNG